MITQCNSSFSCVDFVDVNSSAVAVAAIKCRLDDGCHVGHWLSVVIQVGPWFQSEEDLRICELTPLVSKSAGLSSVGQYFQMALGAS